MSVIKFAYQLSVNRKVIDYLKQLYKGRVGMHFADSAYSPH